MAFDAVCVPCFPPVFPNLPCFLQQSRFLTAISQGCRLELHILRCYRSLEFCSEDLTACAGRYVAATNGLRIYLCGRYRQGDLEAAREQVLLRAVVDSAQNGARVLRIRRDWDCRLLYLLASAPKACDNGQNIRIPPVLFFNLC